MFPSQYDIKVVQSKHDEIKIEKENNAFAKDIKKKHDTIQSKDMTIVMKLVEDYATTYAQGDVSPMVQSQTHIKGIDCMVRFID